MSRLALNFKRFYSVHNSSVRYTIHDILNKYKQDIPLSMCTAYDCITAQWVHDAKCDMILVGDSLAMTSLGYESTTEIPFDEFKYHVKSVSRAKGPSLIVADMPFGSFETDQATAIRNAVDIMKLGSNISSLKLEIGSHKNDTYTMDLVKQFTSRGIPVVGHIGLTPQRSHSLGGFKVQGNKSQQELLDLWHTAEKVKESGAWAIVMECIPHKMATFITSKLGIPTIGIGAGNGTSGQVLVISDLLNMQSDISPKFVKRYSSHKEKAVEALQNYKADVESKRFPLNSEHAFKVKHDIWDDFIQHMDK